MLIKVIKRVVGVLTKIKLILDSDRKRVKGCFLHWRSDRKKNLKRVWYKIKGWRWIGKRFRSKKLVIVWEKFRASKNFN